MKKALKRTPPPTYPSFVAYFVRTKRKDRMTRFRAAAKKANRERLMSPRPAHRLSGDDVQNVVIAARGRCVHCGSLAVENRPSRRDGAPLPWEHIGRRIGSLEHLQWRFHGGDNDLSNIAWACLWCNDHPSERRQGATDHGGFHPPPDDPEQVDDLIHYALISRKELADLRIQLKKARADEDWDGWEETARELLNAGDELKQDDLDQYSELTDYDGPETYCIDDDWLYFGPGGSGVAMSWRCNVERAERWKSNCRNCACIQRKQEAMGVDPRAHVRSEAPLSSLRDIQTRRCRLEL